MRCNACWRELEGQAVTTTCGHLLCTEDASKILSNDAACPICDQVLCKSLMKPVDINPNDEWINTVMAGISPQILMKSSYRSVMFFIGQKDLEMQVKMNRIVAQCQQKCETMQEKFGEKLEQIHIGYQKLAKRCQILEQEIESLSKDKQELQGKFAEKYRLIQFHCSCRFSINLERENSKRAVITARQKRKLDEMYDQARSELESLKQSAIQPANHFHSRSGLDFFSNPAAMMDTRGSTRRDWSAYTPETPVPREEIWPARQNSSNSGPFDFSSGSPARQSAVPINTGNRMVGVRPAFGVGTRSEAANPSMTLRNRLLSPIKQHQFSCTRPQLFS